MKKIFNYVGIFVFSMLAYAGYAQAAADSDLATALSTTTAMATDNKSNILTFLTGVAVVVLVIAVAKGAINWAIAKIAGAIGGKRRRGR